jgi:hypothetical protein
MHDHMPDLVREGEPLSVSGGVLVKEEVRPVCFWPLTDGIHLIRPKGTENHDAAGSLNRPYEVSDWSVRQSPLRTD